MEVHSFLCVLSMAVVIAEGTGAGLYMHNDVIFSGNRGCFLISSIFAIKCICTVNLSADGDPAPGGYVVPEGGSITFTCNSSLPGSGGGVVWEVDLRVPSGRASFIASQGVAALLPQVTSPDTSTLANPTSITISNITSVHA